MHADDNANQSGRHLDTRDEAILSFAQSLLKRTLSESFVGMPLTDSACISSTDSLAAEESSRREFETRRNRLILSSRSLSLELQKQKHRIAAQLVSRSECCICLSFACSSVCIFQFENQPEYPCT